MAKQKKGGARTAWGKIRIGYISDAFCEHPFKDFLPTFFAARDKARFVAVGYADCQSDRVSDMFRDSADEWREAISFTPKEIANAIRKDRIDILVNLSFSRTSERIAEVMRLHPALLQMAMREGEGVDERIRDIHQAGETWLPRLTWCYTPFKRDMDYEVRTPCLDDGQITFGVIGGLDGADPDALREIINAWAGILAGSGGSHLLIPEDIYGALAASGLAETFAAADIDKDRVKPVAGSAVPLADIDIALATPCLDATSLCSACCHGIPTVTLRQPGNSFFRSLWHELGIPQLYATTEKDYVDAALGLATNRDALSRAHQMLRWRLEAAMDPHAYMIAMEDVFTHAWYEHVPAEKPKTLWKEIRQAEQARDWPRALRRIAPLRLRGELSAEFYMTAAWGYSFLGDAPRKAHWARLAMKAGAPHPMTQCYLLAGALQDMRQWKSALEVCEDAFRLEESGEPMSAEISTALLVERGSAAYQSGSLKASEYYLIAHERAAGFTDRCYNYSAWIFSFNSLEVNEEELFERHLAYEDLFRDVKQYSHTGRTRDHSKIRVGYISPDFCAHVMSNFCWPFLATYNRDDFEVYVYSIGQTDQYTETFKSLVDCWRDVKETESDKIAAIIYRDQVDILFDLAGHTIYTGLPALAWKPAPVQISGLGYMATTGLRAVDYFLTDSFVDPPGVNERFFVERLIRIRSQFCYNGGVNLPASEGAPAKKRGWVLFASFNQYRKIRDATVRNWAEILERTPGARLLVKAPVFSDPGMAMAAHERFGALGLDMSRVVLEPGTVDYMARYLDVDIVLDTYPYPGGGTTCDALYMGVPVVTRYSSRHSTRFSYGILAAVGLAELATETPEEYVERAVGLAHDMELLDLLHKNLRSMMRASPLMDPEGYIREVEDRYRDIWNEYLMQSEVHDG